MERMRREVFFSDLSPQSLQVLLSYWPRIFYRGQLLLAGLSKARVPAGFVRQYLLLHQRSALLQDQFVDFQEGEGQQCQKKGYFWQHL